MDSTCVRSVPLEVVRGLLVAVLLLVSPAAAQQLDEDRTPPRLSLVDGDVSFWRPGADDWAAARLNIPLAPGDYLATGATARVEVQVGPRAYLRAGGDSEVGLDEQRQGRLRFGVRSGTVALDVRPGGSSETYELATPQASVTLDNPGYVRVGVDAATTRVTVRRGGSVTVTGPDGQPRRIGTDEEAVVTTGAAGQSALFAAPPVDDWDRWNFERTDALVAAASAADVPAGVYGAEALDQHGSWRVVPTYGRVWMPAGVPPGWAPYSAGRWLWDPYYGWTWVDDAPWGWAPFHYGRWVYVRRAWAWAPGPVVVRPVYAPALVAFFGGGGVRVSVGVPFVSWVALGWGEPVRPWWGPSWYVGRPCWAGWGGPRVVNNIVINNPTTIVDVRHVDRLHHYQNGRLPDAVRAMRRDLFGRSDLARARITHTDLERSRPLRGRAPGRGGPDAVAPALGRGAGRSPAARDRVLTGQRPRVEAGERGSLATRQRPARPQRFARPAASQDASRPAAEAARPGPPRAAVRQPQPYAHPLPSRPPRVEAARPQRESNFGRSGAAFGNRQASPGGTSGAVAAPRGPAAAPPAADNRRERGWQGGAPRGFERPAGTAPRVAAGGRRAGLGTDGGGGQPAPAPRGGRAGRD